MSVYLPYGFWRTGYIYASDFIPFWWLLYIFILYLVLYGFISNFRQKVDVEQTGNGVAKMMSVALGVTGVVSFFLAVGLVISITNPVFAWLYEHIIVLRGFRDSQKFVALVCLCYAYLGGLGVYGLVAEARKLKRVFKTAVMAVVVAAMLTPVIYSFTIFGFSGQVGVTDYPREWYEVNDYLNDDKADFNVLFLPWHLVMDFRWLPNRDIRLGNPAKIFFDKPVIAGDNIEIAGLYSQSTSPISKYVEFILKNGKNLDNLGELLAPLNVKYIILIHEVDYDAYDFLRQQNDIRVELERPGLTLFRNTNPVARIYGVESKVYVRDWEEYLGLSRVQDVTRNLYIIGEGETSSNDKGTDNNPVNIIRNSPVQFEIPGSSHKYTIFTVPQDVNTGYWEYNGQSSVTNLGIMPAFASDGGGGSIVYTRFYRVYLPAYLISGAALLVMLIYYIFQKKKR